MEIEHINEDTIRVRIGNEDLEARGYTFLDLLGNQKQIETFFYSILEEVDLENEFQESDAVTFQVMPNRNGLELYISKDENIHENFFANNEFNNFDEPQPDKDYSQFENISKSNKKEETTEKPQESEEDNQHIVLEFEFFEEIIQLARVFQVNDGITSLYHYNEKFYIEFYLSVNEYSLITPKEKRAIILEYGQHTKVTPEILAEHGKLLIEKNALQTVSNYFLK